MVLYFNENSVNTLIVLKDEPSGSFFCDTKEEEELNIVHLHVLDFSNCFS